jgi:hypothetical protein
MKRYGNKIIFDEKYEKHLIYIDSEVNFDVSSTLLREYMKESNIQEMKKITFESVANYIVKKTKKK